MANNGVITIRFIEGENKTPGPQPINDKMDQNPAASKDNDILKTATLSALIYRTAKQLKGMAINEAKYQIELHFKMNDDYLGLQNMNIALNVVNKVWQTGLSIFTAAEIYGGAGAIAVGAVSVLSTAIQINHNYQQEQIKLNQMNANLSFNRQRAGYSLTAGSIGENR